MFIYAASDQTLGINPRNSAGSFTVQMPESFPKPKNTLLKGQWYLGLIDITVPSLSGKWSKWDVMYVTCAQLEGSIVGDTYSPMLRSIPLGEIKRHNYAHLQPVLYVPVRVADVEHLSFELRDSRGDILQELSSETVQATRCTLELLWRRDINH